MPEKKLAVYDLVRKKKGAIGVIVHSLESPFIPAALGGIQRVAAESGYDVIISHSQESVDKEAVHSRMLYDRGIDGLLACLTHETRDTGHFAPFISEGIPVVFFGRAGRICGCGRVTIDDARCGYLAAEHLMMQGCRRIAMVMPSLEGEPGMRRYAGVQQALIRWNLGTSGRLMVVENTGPEGGAIVAGRVLRMDPMPDGLFFMDDRAAVGCIHALAGAGVRVPEDVAVVGCNNDSAGRLITPALTTVDYPGFEIGQTAAAVLLDRLAGRRAARRRSTTVVPPALIIRNSSLRGQPNVVSWP